MTNIRSNFLKFKKFQSPLERFFFPVVLLLYPFLGITAGLDITDTTYNLANYEFMLDVDQMWILSTFGASFVGRFIMSLPFGGTMVGFGFYCSLIIAGTALIAYYCLQEYMPGWMIFIGAYIAESLCWCPRVILYNYLTYLFLTIGIVFLLKGMFAWKRQGLYLFIAGMALGFNVIVRFPNIVESALIVVLWFYCFMTKQDFKSSLQKTFICILGYIVGFSIPYIGSCILYGPLAYFDMIGSLFGMTKGASDYSSGGMIALIISGYMGTATKMVIMLPCLAAGIMMFFLQKEKLIWVKKAAYILGLLVLVRYFFAEGTFTRNYHYYDSIFDCAMMFIIISLILSLIGSSGVLNGSRQEQTLAFATLMMILVTPLGSNNYTFPIINNLFFIAPISLWLMRRLMQRLGEDHANFTWQSMITMVIIVLIIQGTLFHINFSFVDGADGSKRDTTVTEINKVSGMVTTKANADSLQELSAFLSENGMLEKKTILFGGVPGLAYIFDLEPAINTTWPDLDSYSLDKYEKALEELSVSDNPEPVIIVGKDMQEYANISAKYDILLDYMVEHDYNMVFESERFTVFSAGFESED